MEILAVGYNDSPAAQAARRWAIHYARDRDAEIRLVYVVSSLAEWELAAIQVNTDPMHHELDQRLRGEWSQPLRDAGVHYETQLLTGRPTEELMHYARRERASLIVIGMSPHGTLAELYFGSTTHSLLHHALRPVVAVPADWTDPIAAQ
jgi:nucleotide-binding universal stress UspA family protein